MEKTPAKRPSDHYLASHQPIKKKWQVKTAKKYDDVIQSTDCKYTEDRFTKTQRNSSSTSVLRSDNTHKYGSQD